MTQYIHSWAAWQISARWWRRRTITAWKSPWISLSSVRLTIHGCVSIPAGSAGVPTAAFATRRIHPRNTRISSMSISMPRRPSPTFGWRC
ncbi:hypothetical protein D9M68_892140 [compost metagenome]